MVERRLLDELNRATTPISRPNPLVVLWRWRYEAAAVALLPLLANTVVDSFGAFSLAVVVVPAAALLWPSARSEAWGRIRCVVTAHRIRVGLVEAFVVSRRGKIPVIVWCAPAPFGERVWLWCRAGTTASAVEKGRDVIATACWATEVIVRPKADSPHWVLLEIVRRGRAYRTVPDEPRSARGML
ncbi:hypothetical protein [Nonomuraea rhizosphaerae]|uniref:hypothetical protein n=1 Tax=Nonomuraea rhizosphaerae TaxID=2665663 RepID=UPI001C5E1D39|nr:hypothetical protein [Nonomuraea rhizosphaerae]